MNAKEVYKVWARPSIWSGWVRPVPFIDIDKDYKPDAILPFLPETVSPVISLAPL